MSRKKCDLLSGKDGNEEMQYNLTQIPFDVEIDEHGFVLNYKISIYFEIEDLNL